MEPIIYSTYGTAMRHRPEDLAASGGLRPLGASRPRERRARIGLVRLWSWLALVAARVRPRPRATSGLAGAGATSAAILPGNR